jgi:IS4 transposase
MKDCTELKQITEVLNKFTINDIGNRSKFCKRERAIKPFELVMSLITGLGDKSVDTLSDLHRYFVTLTETDVCYKPFHKQLSKPEFVVFMKRLVGVAMAKLQQQILGTTHNLSDFKKVIVQDGSSFAVHDSLQDDFKGRFTKISPAAVELHVTWDILNSTPAAIQLAPDHVTEYNFLPDASSLKNCLFMGDRGYFKLAYFDNINESGGSYLVRSKTSFKPDVIAGFNKMGKRLKRFTGKSLTQLKKYIRRSQLVDMDVCRKGKHYRLIASWPKGKSEPTYWITNLDREKFSGSDVTKLYRLRWQIELLFKEWKSWNNLKKFNTRKKEIMEGLIWASLLSMLIKRSIAFSVESLSKIEVSTFMVAKNTQGWFYPLMEAITLHVYSEMRYIWSRTIKYLSQYARRASQFKDRQTGRLQYGVEPINA